MTTGWKMPDPWLRAHPTALCIAEMRGEPHRPAGPDERVLGRFILPPFQRPAVWTTAQQVKLLESIWERLPIGSYVFNQSYHTGECDGWLLDGQQRITAILAYLDDAFPVFGWRWSEITLPEQRGFLMSPVSCLITDISDRARCQDVYTRLAYGGTAHT